ncbi:uncharacterized protein LOC111269683 [Varroa jacobsoni]|uniref:uncharacterized protein LOC111269683 n=1 Tax=Varroa jacobsoni TaxID=62625 RepID=UPI000BF2BA6D|nr:uncharacterized protein LOC111269683 [Varroa jacobsoni]
MAPERSKDLLALEHRSKERHLERLLASQTKPNIERLHSTVLQDAQRFLPLMQRANETLMQRIRPVQAETPNLVEDTTGPSIRTFDNENTSQNEACFELDENHVGIAIEMNLILAPEDQIKVITNMEAVVRASQPDTISDSDNASITEDSEPDSSSDNDDDLIKYEKIDVVQTIQQLTSDTADNETVSKQTNKTQNNGIFRQLSTATVT